MRSVSLDAKDIEPLLKELTDEELKAFESKKENYEKMWKDQGFIFWIKFVVTVKDILCFKLYDWPNNDKSLDSLLSKWLLTLPEKNINLFVNIVFLQHCCFPTDDDFSKCLGAFVRLYDVWKNSKSGNSYTWNIPKYWENSSGYTTEVETSILKLLKDHDIENVFNCKKENIYWLKNYSPPNIPSSNLPDENTELREEIQNSELATCKSEGGKPPDFETEETPDVESEEPLDVESGKPPDFKRTCLLWLPKQEATSAEHQQMTLFPLLRDIPTISARVFNLMEISLPPLLARKFHIVNVAELMKDGEDKHYMGVATWFSMWSQAFGISYLNTVHRKYEELKKLKHDDHYKLWKSDVDKILHYMGQASESESAPRLQDNAETASEFLLEPCIIIQLPWNNVLLHQWLAAALVEVLIFEKSSLELRHWPLSPELEPTARDLLTLVKQLKERVVLGFAIMSQQVVSHPNVESSHPTWIMDEVILPSLATLQFLTSKEAYNVLNNIKKVAWENTGSTNGKIYVPMSAYTMESNLNDIFLNLCYNSSKWSYQKETSSPFPLKKCEQTNLKRIIKNLKRIKPINQDENSSIKPLSKEEDLALQFIESNQCEKVSDKKRIPFLLDTIKELIIDKGRLPNLKWSSVKQIFDSDEMRQFANHIFTVMNMRTPHIVAIGYSLLIADHNQRLTGSEPENSILATIVELGIKIIKQESIIRLTNSLSVMFKMSPVAINLVDTPPMTVESMSQVLQEVRSKSVSQTRDWLWTQFPAKWRKPVGEEPALKLSLGTETIVKACEERIGRIVYNVARNSFSAHKKGYDVFECWQVVQYILPCYVAAFVHYKNNPNTNSNTEGIQSLLKFINEMLKCYEKTFKVWMEKGRSCGLTSLKIPLKMETEDINELHSVLVYYKNQINFYFCCFIDSKNSEEFFWAKQINEALLEWPVEIMEQKKCDVLNENLGAWSFNSFFVLKHILLVCDNTWNELLLPKPNKRLKQISEFYHTDRIVRVLETVFSMIVAHMPIEVIEDPNSSYIHEVFADARLDEVVDVKRVQAFLILKNNCSQEKGSMLNTISISKYDENSLLLLYLTLKKFRYIVTYFSPLHFIPLLNLPRDIENVPMHFQKGNFETLEKMLPKLAKNIINLSTPCFKEFFDEQALASNEEANSQHKERSSNNEKCRNCPETERKLGQFLVCKKCLEDKYPDVNFFCSKKCQDERWGAEHMAEHLEFDLGLTDFSHLNLNE